MEDSGRINLGVGCGSAISFGPHDLEGLELPHDDALIIIAIITNSHVARVFIDTGSSLNVLFRTAFEEMQIDASELQLVATSLYGFTEDQVPVGEQVREVKGEQWVSRQCYIYMVKVEARKAQRTQDGVVHAIQEEPMPMVEELIPWEEVQLYPERPESLTRIAGDLSPELKEELIQCLTRNRDVFSWSTQNYQGIDQLVDSTTGYERILHAGCLSGVPSDPPDPRGSGEATNLIADVEETCGTLRQYGLKLNPLKCLFGAKRGKFLGYLVTEQGIEANPEKVQALWDMRASQNLKEAQKLVGRITALSRFISESTDKAAPFFKVLRKAFKFQWDEECTWAFEELKKYLETLPSLFKPITGEPFWVYLSATPKAMREVLVKEQDNIQQPVYFFSHLLKGDESKNTALEKLVYGLVFMAQRLRPYFQAHPITVLTNNIMGKALTNVEVACQLIKWATELGEYNIVYQPHTTIKAQALADFLTEIHQTDSEETWKLNLRATNNEVEYEALLAGLQATRHMGAARVIIYSDSQLVTQQVARNFEVNSNKLQVYREAYEKMKEEFKEVTVSKIPRTENGRADELAKMASSLTTWVLDRSIAQTFLIAQIDLQNNMEELIDWRAAIISYLQQSILQTDLEEERLVRKKAHAYTMIGD
ncbi:uncharacterized protein LOC122043670 [Zingiber officinale]|uniref:uncharacterized protein LOC122043670 n=1 Tax=Zingiber officinale TaxID=94328 RepID=UPI001C4B7FF3|nr:uncharacterized protein LOC122043670 [Zingiber officinale]